MRVKIKFCLLLLCLFVLNEIVSGGKVSPPRTRRTKSSDGNGRPVRTLNANESSSGTFNVISYGAKGDGKHDDSQAFAEAWKAACGASGTVTLEIPKATYLVGPVKFSGPCTNVKSITVDMKGYLKATTDLKMYGKTDDWIEFGWVDGLTLTGDGTFDGQGAESWSFNKCPVTKNCQVLPTNVKFVAMTNTVVRGITSLNSKFFHMGLIDCKNFVGSEIRISAPENSPNTDGIHIERCTGVEIYHSSIGTGDDCISIGHGNSQVTISGVTCGPGHGISIGSLGRYQNEGDVTGVTVRDCTISGTTNGVRIKTWENSPSSTVASNMTFQDIVVNNVANPIIIDQTYCPYVSCSSTAPSRVKLQDLHFKNIRGTSSSPVAVMLECSRGVPCQNVNLHDVHIELMTGGTAKSSCQNIKATYSGTQIPAPCSV